MTEVTPSPAIHADFSIYTILLHKLRKKNLPQTGAGTVSQPESAVGGREGHHK